jgi:hypothetical protein
MHDIQLWAARIVLLLGRIRFISFGRNASLYTDIRNRKQRFPCRCIDH